MKKVLKIILILFALTGLLTVIDLIWIFTMHKPLFAVKTENYGSLNEVYKGLFYDTYNCAEYSTSQIKSKFSKFSCAVARTDIGKVLNIVDTTKDIKDFACSEALESFYEDEVYTYFWNCIKNKYMIVKYESGYEETINNALKYGSITINDLDNFNVKYIRKEKEVILKEDIISKTGLLFTISYQKGDCIPVNLVVYDNGKYELYTEYKGCPSNEACNLMLKYTKSTKGTYDYDVMKIINYSLSADNMTFTNDTRAEYEIYTGNGEKYYMLITNSNNKYLNEFLKQINVDLHICADVTYK